MDNKVMFNITYGLYVLTANEKGKDNGCIINTLSQVTSTPNRISITVNKSNHTHDMIKNTKKFNVSLLTEQTSFDLFKHFGFQTGKDTDKFADYEGYARAENGIVYLTKYANSFISGDVIQEIDLGTHTMFIADAVDGQVISDVLSVSYAYYHKNIKPAPEAKKAGGWRCKICGYVYEGDELPADFVCPLCKHPASDFEKI
ncbi:MAG: flavin reductase [Clostridiales bacterium]|nr:flavin reductase [Clostridiales bacterium]